MTLIEVSRITVPPVRLRRTQASVVADLAASLQAIGLLHPITVGEDFNLLAGLHRLEAAKSIGWKEIEARVIAVTSLEARLAEIDENLARADLSPAERAAHQAERKRLYEDAHPGTRHGGDRKSSSHGENLKQRYTADAARKQGRSQATVYREAARGEAIPNVARLAGTALDSAKELDALAKLGDVIRDRLIEKATSGEKVSASQEVKRVRRDEREQELAERTLAASATLGEKRYGVILSDPPWRFEPYSRDTGMDRAADNHYPTLDLSGIRALNAPAADDCVLFLWATIPMLPQALEVMAAWGFTYKSQFVWVKDKAGTGFWVREQHELLLIGTRGHVPAPAQGDQYSSVISALRGRHSEKPFVVHDMIEEMYPTLPRLEMFARKQYRGWDQWGNEATV